MRARLQPLCWLTCTFLLPDNMRDLWASTGHRCASHKHAQKNGTQEWNTCEPTSYVRMLHREREETHLQIFLRSQTPTCPSCEHGKKTPQWLQSAPTKMQSSFSTSGIFIFNWRSEQLSNLLAAMAGLHTNTDHKSRHIWLILLSRKGLVFFFKKAVQVD